MIGRRFKILRCASFIQFSFRAAANQAGTPSLCPPSNLHFFLFHLNVGLPLKTPHGKEFNKFVGPNKKKTEQSGIEVWRIPNSRERERERMARQETNEFGKSSFTIQQRVKGSAEGKLLKSTGKLCVLTKLDRGVQRLD